MKHEGVGNTPYPCVSKESLNVFEAGGFAVDEVITAAVSGHAASNRDFVELCAELNLAFSKGQRDLTCGQCFALVSTLENDVLHGGTTQSLGALLSEHPADRIDDVTLTATIGSNHGGHPFLEV